MTRRIGVTAASIAIAAGIVVGFQLRPYADDVRPDVSYDSYYYVWRTSLLGEEGVAPFRELPTALRPNLDRPGFPAIGAVLGSALGIDAFTFMIVVRAVAALAIGASAAALAWGPFRHPPWAIAVMVVALGTSAAVTGTASSSLENLLADVPLMGLTLVLALVLARRASVAAIALLLGGAALLHWLFASLFALLVLAVLVLDRFLPVSVDDDAGTDRPSAAPIALAAVGGVIVAAILMPALPQQLPPPTGDRGNLNRLWLYELPLLVPLALAALVVTFRRTDRSSRVAWIVVAAWAASVPLAVALSFVLPEPLKLFRIAAFGLGIPAAIGLGLVGIARIAGERWGAAAGATAIVLGAVVLAVAAPARSGPFNAEAAARQSVRFHQAGVAAAYLADSAPGRRVVFVVQERPWMFDRVFRAAMPPRTIARMHVYVGDAEALALGRPLSDPARPALSALSRSWWEAAWPAPDAVLREDPVVIAVDPLDDRGASIGAGLRVIRGPRRADGSAAPTPIVLGWIGAVGWTVVVLVALALCGLGWARALLDVDPGVAILVSPAFGVAVLVLAGTVAARVGAPLSGWPGRVSVGLSLVASLALLAVHRSPRGAGEPSSVRAG